MYYLSLFEPQFKKKKMLGELEKSFKSSIHNSRISFFHIPPDFTYLPCLLIYPFLSPSTKEKLHTAFPLNLWRISCRYGASLPLNTLVCIFLKNEDLILRNHSTVIKNQDVNSSNITCTLYSYFPDCPNSVVFI